MIFRIVNLNVLSFVRPQHIKIRRKSSQTPSPDSLAILKNITAIFFHGNIPSSVPVPITLSRTLMIPFPVPFPCLLERTLAPPPELVRVVPLRTPKRPQKAALIRRGRPMIAFFFVVVLSPHS